MMQVARASLSRSGRHLPRRSRRAMVLLLVTIVVAILSLAGFSFVALMSSEDKAIRTHGAEVQIRAVMASGVAAIEAFVAQPYPDQQAAGGTVDNPDVFHNILVLDDTSARRRGWFSVVAPRIEGEELTGIRFGLENESAKLNLASVLEWETRQPGAGRQALLKLPNMTETLADSILDWIDPDSEPRQFGAEADFYTGRGVPYGPRNALPVSLEELLLVRGVTRDLLLGSDTNFNHTIDADEATSYADRLTALRSGGASHWTALLTVVSAERNLTPEGAPRIDLNAPNLKALHARLAEVFGPRAADFVAAYRQFGPYRGSDAAAAAETELHLDFALPGKYWFSSVLDLVGARVRVVAQNAVTPVVLDSPLASERSAMQDYLPTLLDYATIGPARPIRGRINVNLAPRVVLEGIPGMDDSLVSRIVGSRPSADPREESKYRWPTWLLTEGVVDLARMKALLPYITAGGDVYRAQVVAYFDVGGPSARVEVVVDATSVVPRELHWKDLGILGRGYPPELLEPPQTDRKPLP